MSGTWKVRWVNRLRARKLRMPRPGDGSRVRTGFPTAIRFRPQVEELEVRTLLAVQAVSLADPRLFSDTAGSPFDTFSMSADGRFVTFAADTDNLVLNDSNGVEDVFVRDLQAGTTTLVSVNLNGTGGNGRSTNPVIS